MKELLDQVLKEIKPSKEERELVEKIKGEVEGIAREIIAAFGYDVEPYFVGSLAKDTYLAGDHDIDLFLAFPPETPLEELRERGLGLAKAIGEKLGKYEVAYAEHPYVRALYRGFKVDLVPCYNVRDWREVKTAVDRSILHTKWILKHLNSKNDEVRLLKKFFKGINVYGSEIYIKGFSGYLTELLIIKYGSFLKVLENHDFMLRQKIIDLEGWLKKEPEVAMKTVKREADADVPLIVIDPVDPRRNVASALSWEKFGIFYFKAKQFLEKPTREFFFPEHKQIGDYKKVLREKGTKLVTLLFKKPDLIDDLLLPQLEKSAKGFMKALELQGFRVFETHWGYKDKAFIMLEVDRVERSRIEIKPGPEFFTERGLRFYSKNQKVWIRGKRLYSEKVVKEGIVDVIRELLEKNQVSLGKQVKEYIMRADILINFVPPELSDEAYLFLSREKWNLKG
ncbi:CCA tRNA nucleotidyltransferase [Thermococcus paralvinellae]|uniref:CCA-adding enzyme n=1 Tax=Thermococcus paralvinellae TaxID=582419 RepID=W0I3Z6_9EURY|nr:CCA tRNA nucleotidyltransferase [Thermococcus paralvinellae]AHF79422.1 Archaeal tRNA nucleotidyltransferase [Thermococcus paralvinellae]